MSRFYHNDLKGETVAKRWHQVACIISVAATVSGIGIAITAGVGALWHIWAADQHQQAINRIKGELQCQPGNAQRK